MFYRCTLGVLSYINNFANSLNEYEFYDCDKLVDSFFNLSQIEHIWLNMWNNLTNNEKEIIKILMNYSYLTFEELVVLGLF